MKSISTKLLPFFLIAVLFTACSQAGISEEETYKTTYPSQFISGDVFILKRYEKIDGDVVGVDTTLIIEEGASVLGDINLLASDLEVGGRVAGEVNLFGGTSHVLRSGLITGSINRIANDLLIEPGAVIYGEINTFSFPDENQPEKVEIPRGINTLIKPRTWIIIQVVRNILLILTNLLIIYLFDQQTFRVAEKFRKDPLVSWIVGLVTFIAVPIVATILIISICLSPIGLILLLALVIANIWGYTIISYFAGIQLARWFKINTGKIGIVSIGSLFFSLVLSLAAFIPFLSMVLSWILSAFGTGAIILSLLTRKK